MNNHTGSIISVIVLIALIVGAIYWYATSAPVQTPPATVPPEEQSSVTFPSGGDVLNAGQMYTLQWSMPSAQGTTTQLFLVDTALEEQGESVSISDRVYNIPDAGSYQYAVPTSTPPGVYRLEIGTLRSDNFQIASSTTGGF